MIGSKLVKKALATLLKSGGDFAELFIQKRSLNNLRIEDGKIEKSTSGYELGCGLRLIYRDSTFYAYVDSLEGDKILNAAKVLSSAVNESQRLKVLDLNERKSTYSAPVDRHPSGVSQGEKRDYLLKADKAARGYADSIIQVTASLSDLEETTFFPYWRS